ncbi:hypothetical protein GGR53DRAFT_470180 [Hypoxylon sp. FL1150]|nr:hypothetical protein GGR53DRAFT_470180 [Hypoxylon sp. FL1150]
MTSLVNAILPITKGTFLALVKTLDQFHLSVLPKARCSTSLLLNVALSLSRRACYATTTKASYFLYEGIYGVWKDVTRDLVAVVDLHFTIQPITTSLQRQRDGTTKGPAVLWAFH